MCGIHILNEVILPLLEGSAYLTISDEIISNTKEKYLIQNISNLDIFRYSITTMINYQ